MEYPAYRSGLFHRTTSVFNLVPFSFSCEYRITTHFSSLGVVISVIISIPKPSLSFKLILYPKLSVTLRGRHWLGARMLDKAGFNSVALYGRDATFWGSQGEIVHQLNVLSDGNPQNGMLCSSYAQWVWISVVLFFRPWIFSPASDC